MKEEISAAVFFFTRLIEKNRELSKEQVQTFSLTLTSVLMEKFKGHWFPEKPCKGQAYRCIRVNETERYDPVLQEAAQRCGLKYSDLKLPLEFTMWVDPHEVCCRFGEHKGSCFTLASFKDGNKENFVDKVNTRELEQKTAEILKKAAQDVLKRRKSRKHTSTRKNNYNPNFIPQQSILQQLPAVSSSSQNFQPPVFSASVPSFNRGHLPSHLSNYNNLSSAMTPTTFYPQFYTSSGSNVPHHSPKYPRGYHMQKINHLTSTSSNRFNESGKVDRYHWVNKKAEVKA